MAKKIFSLFLIVGAGMGAVVLVGSASLSAKVASPKTAILTEAIPNTPGATASTRARNETLKLLEGTLTKIREEANKSPDQQISGAIPNINPEEIAESILSEGQAAFDPETFRVSVSLESLIITPSKDKTAIESYFKGVQAILQSASAITQEFTKTDPSPKAFGEVAKTVHDTATNLYTLPVPAPAAHLHARQIGLMQTQANIFSALAKADQDPVLALFALQTLEALQPEFDAVGKDFSNLLSQYGITY
ncbi:MAG: hypothetical protein AAB407_01175 [Patescibacteria group bacterium]